MKKRILFLLVLIPIIVSSQSVSEKVLKEYEDTLSSIAHTMMHGKTEQIRTEANKGFISELLEVLQYSNSYFFPFDSLKTISRLQPEDNSFRLFNWILKKDNGTYQYFAYIVLPPSKNENRIIKLKETEKHLLDFKKSILHHTDWYGALYYKIISPKKNNKHYTLLAWDGNNTKSIIKIIDILEIKDDGIWFGKDLFLKDGNTTKRIVVEYNSNTSVSVNYDKEKNRIILDHLVPLKEGQEEYKAFYVPDGSYDCYQYKNGKWIFKEDIDARTSTITPRISKEKQDKGLFKK